MKTPLSLTTLFGAVLISVSSFAQNPTSPNAASIPSDSPKATGSRAVNTGQVAVPAQPATSQPNPEAMMKQMLELAQLNENHKLLADLDGTWNYTIRFWMNPDPNAKPQESKGTAVRKSVMDGRYSVTDVNGKMEMPGPDGKKKETIFKGMGIEGYDNVKKKFVASWIDNMGTGIEFSEGTYDPATKSFTYTFEMEAIPGMKTAVREVVKIADKDHMSLEWYENQGGQEKKTMEIAYTRATK